MSIIKKILQLQKRNIDFFTTPSHAQMPVCKSKLGNSYFKYDLSEVDDLDDLNNPQGCILEFENKLKDIYSSEYSHILTNGSTQGILALMLAVIKKHDKVMCAANCHKSVHNGLVLTGANPVWIYPEFCKEFGVYTQLNAGVVEKALANNPDTICLIITNPTYDGAVSEIEKISELCKENNVILIVDEAHGGLWNFDKSIGTPAILAGADASVQSLHKTCGAVNPAAILHLSKNSRISKEKVLSALNLVSTTSPSFALMVNIEETIDFLTSKKGKKALYKLSDAISQTLCDIKQLEAIEVFEENNDFTRIFIRPTKMSAEEASEILYSKFKIECEIQHNNSLTFVCGMGTTAKKLKKLTKALKYINKISKTKELLSIEDIKLPTRIITLEPRLAFSSNYEEVQPQEAIGKTCAEIITTYPPGIPILTYGEMIQEEHLSFLNPEIKIRIVK